MMGRQKKEGNHFPSNNSTGNRGKRRNQILRSRLQKTKINMPKNLMKPTRTI
jgi:hypothetical protein